MKTPFSQWFIHSDHWVMVGIYDFSDELPNGKKITYKIKPSLKTKEFICTIECDDKVQDTQSFKTITNAKNFVTKNWENLIAKK